VTPEIPGLWKTMQENDQWPFSFDHSAQRDTVGRNTLKITLFHISLWQRSRIPAKRAQATRFTSLIS
jgi:hypothetical protein